MDKAPWTDDAISARLENLFADDEATSDTQWAYREAASVLAYYDLGSLRPVGGPIEGSDAAGAIGGDSELTSDESGQPRWTLCAAARRETLKRLSGERLRAALEANPTREPGVLQQMLQGYLLGTARPLESQNLDELRATVRVSELLDGIVETLPDPIRLAQRLERETLLAQLRALVGDHFAGRESELRTMTDYVAALDARSFTEKAVRAMESTFSVQERPALCVYGPGGIGKSTLVAKFILDHSDASDDRRVAFAYFDFDRPGLIAEEPITLLFEALRQLSSQYPESKPRMESLRQEWARRVADSKGGTARAATEWKSLRLRDRDYYLESFSRYVESLGLNDQPLLFVLDTLEEVQLRSQALVEEVLTFLAALQKRLPRLRSVLSGRVLAESTRYPIWPLELKTFDRASARAFLMFKVPGLSTDVADIVAKQVGGSPLTLKLAVVLLTQDTEHETTGPDGIRDLRTSLLARLRGESIQSQLYTRILGHIKNDEDVKKLAHPGLILRRITPELILKVLAEPCGVNVPDLDAARALLDRLRKQVVLVTATAPEVLIHRPDLRAVMLEPLRQAEEKRVEQIHRNAITFYERLDDPESRAEEIYHRLSLGLDRAQVNARWMEGLKKPLQGSLQELPPASQAYLAAKFDLEIDSELWVDADQEDWETYAARQAQEHLKLDKAGEALSAVRQRASSTWTAGSALYLIEVDALIRLGRVDEAREALERAAKQSAHLDRAGLARLEEQRQLLGSSDPSTDSPTLDSSRLRTLLDALVDAIPRRSDLEEMVRVELGRDLAAIAPEGSIEDTMFRLIRTADAEGWIGELVVAARNTNPGNSRLFAFAQQIGLSSATSGWQIDTFLNETGRPVDPETFRRRLTDIESQICQIEIPAGKDVIHATGFLVGPRAVLTSYDVIEGLLPNRGWRHLPNAKARYSDMVMRFDYRGMRGGTLSAGSSFQLSDDWLIDASPGVDQELSSSPHLDYALLRVRGTPGEDPGTSGTRRGWIIPGSRPVLQNESPLAIVHYAPDGSPKLTLDIHGLVKVDERGRLKLAHRLLAGSWGAPCFDERLELIAMLAGDPEPQGWRVRLSEAVPIRRIMETLEARGLAGALGESASSPPVA